MIKKILTYYKIPLLVSTTIGVVIMAMGVVRNPLDIAEVVIGVIIGTFILDSEYVLYSYIFEPNTDFAKSIFAYIKHKDFGGLIGFINEHKDEVKDKSFNSVLFQAVLVPLCIYVTHSPISYFIKALLLATLGNSIYKLIECYFEGDTKEWFWAIKGNPRKEGVLTFIIGLILVLVYCLWMI